MGEGALPLEQIPLSNSARSVFRNFPDAVAQIRRLYHDPLLTEQGDLTETRDYVTYTRAMAEAVDLKYAEIKPFLRPGKIVDEGCADGALLERVAQDFPDSDLIGVDLSSEMLARAHEAQRAGAFGGAFVFFKQQNLMTPVSEAQARSVDVVICNSTLHELWSYGDGDETVRAYLRGKYRQLRPGGRLVIRDVVGPDDRDTLVLMECASGRWFGPGTLGRRHRRPVHVFPLRALPARLPARPSPPVRRGCDAGRADSVPAAARAGDGVHRQDDLRGQLAV